ncbi:MAG: thioredoxin domain-containing protein [Candidatus Falkowbacteria bacterium]
MKNLKKIIIPIVIILAVIIIAYIFLRPKNIVKNDDIKALGNLGASEAKAQSYVAAKTPTLKNGDMIFGAKDAPLKIFVYEDNSSIYSAQLADTLDKLHTEMSTKIAIIIRPFVTKNSSLNKEAALAVECAGSDKWMAMRALLFAKAKNNNINLSEFSNYAKEIGLDENAFASCLTNAEKSAKIEKLSEEAGNFNVLGAPTIFIGDEMILGARPYEDYTDSNGDNIEGLKTVVSKKIQ